MNENYSPHHERDPNQPPWRLSTDGQTLRAGVIENIGKASQRPPRPEHTGLILGVLISCMRTHWDGTRLSHEDARAAAALLSTAIEDEEGSHLEDIAEGRGIRPGSTREELRELWNRQGLYDNPREIINILGNYLLSEEHPNFAPTVPADMSTRDHRVLRDENIGHAVAFHYRTPQHLNPDQAVAEAQRRAGRSVEMLGDAGLAFMRRPSIDALTDDLPQRFGEEYLHSATHPHLIFERLHGHTTPPRVLSQEIELIHAGNMVHAFKRPPAQQKDNHGA